MILLWKNLCDSALLSAGSEIITLPASNIQNDHLSRRWHTQSGVKSTSLVIDLKASHSCGAFAVLGTNLTNAATFRLRASDNDETVESSLVYDSGILAGRLKAGYGTIYHVFPDVAGRYWRFEPEDPAALDHLEIGRVVLGPKWTPSMDILYGWTTSVVDNSRLAKSYGGQTFVHNLPKIRTGRLELSFMGEAEMYGNPFAAFRDNGLGRDLLVVPNPEGAFVHQQSLWGLLTQVEGIVAESHNVYRTVIASEERL